MCVCPAGTDTVLPAAAACFPAVRTPARLREHRACTTPPPIMKSLQGVLPEMFQGVLPERITGF